MSSLDSVGNATFFRPSMFYLSGFYNVPHTNYYYIFLAFVYIVTVLGNSVIMCTVYLARSLHTAKYIAIVTLALSDIAESSALIPKLLDTFLFGNQYISYESCLANMFFVFHFMGMQSLSLLALAYDRVIAICFPLRYHAIVTKKAMAQIIGIMWIFSVAIFTLMITLVTRLSFCRSTTINSYFCDHGPVVLLACNSIVLNVIMAYACFAVLICIPIILIAISYVCIGVALLKMSHKCERSKAMKTCTSHILLVAVTYLPILGNNIATVTTSIGPNERIINSILTQTVPPMINPIIYTLKTEEVMQAIKVICKQAIMALRKNSSKQVK